jgi:hypothetical protein
MLGITFKMLCSYINLLQFYISLLVYDENFKFLGNQEDVI